MDYAQSVKTANEVWRKIVGQVTGVLSIIIFECTLEYTNRLQTGIISLVASFSYVALDTFVRRSLLPPRDHKNEIWRVVVGDLLDYFFSTAIFLITQWIAYFISSQGNGSGISFAEKLVSLFAVVIFYAFVVTMFRYISKKSDDAHSRGNTFSRVWNSIFGTTIQFFSSSILSELLVLPNQLQVAITTFVVAGTYISVDWAIRGSLKKMENTPERRMFYDFLMELLDIGYTMSIFVSIFYFGAYLREQSRSGVMNLAEQTTTLLAAALVINSVFEVLSELSQGNEGKWVVADAANRIWSKIAGTVYGTFSGIFTLQISLRSNRSELIFIVLLSSFAYLTVDNLIRTTIKAIANRKHDREWVSVVYGALDFFFSIAFLIPLDYYAEEVSDDFTGDVYSFEEKLASVFGIAMTVYPIFSILKVLARGSKK